MRSDSNDIGMPLLQHCLHVFKAARSHDYHCSMIAYGVQAALRDKLLQDHSVLAAFLTGLRMYLEDPTKVMHLLSTLPCTTAGAEQAEDSHAI